MKHITDDEIEEAKRQLAKLRGEHLRNSSAVTEADRDLLRRYPKHTLAAARLIDQATFPRQPLPDQIIRDAGEDFQFLQWQESGTPYTRQ